jgi:hypothetical protein
MNGLDFAQVFDFLTKLLATLSVTVGPWLLWKQYKVGKRKIDSATAADSLAGTAAEFAENVAQSYERQFAILNQTIGKLEAKIQQLEEETRKDDITIAEQMRTIKQQGRDLTEARHIIEEQSRQILMLTERVSELERTQTKEKSA